MLLSAERHIAASVLKLLTTGKHLKTMAFMTLHLATLYEDGEIALDVKNSTHLKDKNYVGSHITRYDSMLMLSHFKGHARNY